MPKLLGQGALAALFLMELCLLAAFAFWGFQTGVGLGAKLALGIGAPLLVAIVWGLVMAPRARIHLPLPLHLALFVVIFGAATLALWVAGQPTLAIAFALVSFLSKGLSYLARV